MSIFKKEQIENLLPDGRSRIQFRTKSPERYTPKWLDYQYRSPDYDEILLATAPAINLNHTSLKVSEWLYSTLPDSFWNDPKLYKRKFLNPFVDSGFSEKYLIKRLAENEQMIKKFPDYAQRIYHILHNMVYGITKTNAASLWARKIIYYSANATIRRNDNLDHEQCHAIFNGKLFQLGYDADKLESYKKTGNIKSPYIPGVIGRDSIFDYPMLDWMKDKTKDPLDYFALVFWDIFTNEDYEKLDDDRRNALMKEIKQKLNGYFDVIIGNPPYNTNNEETGKIAETVYNYFCMAADKLNPKYETFIIPSKWLYGKARIPQEFSQSILNSKNACYLRLVSGEEAFPSVDTGDISIYSIDNTRECDEFTYDNHGEIHKYRNVTDITYEVNGKRWLKLMDSVVEKIEAKGLKSLADDSKIISISSDYKYDIFGNDALSSAIAFKYDYGKLVKAPDGTMIKRPTYDYSLTKDSEHSLKFYMPKVKLWKVNANGDHEYPNLEKDKMIGHIYISPLLIKNWMGNKFEHEVLVTTTINNYHKRLLDYPYNAFIMKPDEATEGLVAIGYSLKTHQEVVNLQKFMRTKFATYLITLNQVSQQFTSESLRFCPYMDFTQEWDDAKLNEYFGLTEEEIKRIDDLWAEFRPMRRAQMMQQSESEDDDAKE